MSYGVAMANTTPPANGWIESQINKLPEEDLLFLKAVLDNGWDCFCKGYGIPHHSGIRGCATRKK